MNITSKDTMIFAKEFDGKMHYRAGLSTKKQDGSYDKAYIDIRLPKGESLPNKTKINITRGFLTFYKTKEGKDIWYIVVQEFTTEETKDVEVLQVESKRAEDYDTGMELPFWWSIIWLNYTMKIV